MPSNHTAALKEVLPLLPAIQSGDREAENLACQLLMPLAENLVAAQLKRGSCPVLDKDAYMSVAGERVVKALRNTRNARITSADGLSKWISTAIGNGIVDEKRSALGTMGGKGLERVSGEEYDKLIREREAPAPVATSLDEDQTKLVVRVLKRTLKGAELRVLQERVEKPEATAAEISQQTGWQSNSVGTYIDRARRKLATAGITRQTLANILSGEERSGGSKER